MTARQRILVAALIGPAILAAACEDELVTSVPPNQAPVFQDIPDTSVSLGGTLDLPFLATDFDGDTLAYELTSLISLQEFREGYQPDAAIDPDLRMFRFTPVARDAPARSFRIAARDGHGNADSTTFRVAIE